LRVTAGRHCPSQWRPESSLDVVRKRIDDSAFVVTFICPEEPAVNERVDLGAVKFDDKAAISGTTACPATAHSACGGFPSGFGFDGHTVPLLLHHADVLSDESAVLLYQIGLIAARFQAMATTSCRTAHSGLFFGEGAGSAVWRWPCLVALSPRRAIDVPPDPAIGCRQRWRATSGPRGLSTTLQLLKNLCQGAIEGLDMTDEAVRNPPYVHPDVDNMNVSPIGTSRDHALRRLRDHRPDLHERVLAGELSPHRAMIEAGFSAPYLPVPRRVCSTMIFAKIDLFNTDSTRLLVGGSSEQRASRDHPQQGCWNGRLPLPISACSSEPPRRFQARLSTTSVDRLLAISRDNVSSPGRT
jgi:hypothetical protein